MSTPERTENDLRPVVKSGNREPIALVDISTSMTWEVADGSNVKRMDVVGEAIGLLVAALEGQDSQAAAEQAGGDDDMGGLLVHLFSSGTVELGDLNSSNWRRKWDSIQWGGGTKIMQAWEAAQQAYVEEFEEMPVIDRPALLTLVITDGEAADAADFREVLDAAGPGRFFCIAIVGYGPEHDRTLRSYKEAEATNAKHVRVVSFEGETNPRSIADGLISLVG